MPRMEPTEPNFTTVIWTDGQSDDESTCRECGREFEPGDEVLVVFGDDDRNYCGARCANASDDRATARYEYRLGI
jgi:hypothetical protein